MKKQRRAVTCKEKVIALYCPYGIITGWIFHRRLSAVLKEAGCDSFSDDKLLFFEEKYAPVIKRYEFDNLIYDMIVEHRRFIGAESYIRLYQRKFEK